MDCQIKANCKIQEVSCAFLGDFMKHCISADEESPQSRQMREKGKDMGHGKPVDACAIKRPEVERELIAKAG